MARNSQAQAGPPQAPNKMKTAPLIRSLVHLQREKCALEQDQKGSYIKFSCSAKSAGEATAFFLTEEVDASATAIEPLKAAQISRQRFQEGKSENFRLFLSSDLAKSLGGFEVKDEEKKYQLVVDLRTDSEERNLVTAQRSMFKFSEDTKSVQVIAQQVQHGGKLHTVDALYGTMPNPSKGATRASEASAGGDEGGTCVICLEKPREVAILHCRHICICSDCAQITSSTWSFSCPVCRGRVAAMVGLEKEGDGEKPEKSKGPQDI